MASQAAIAAALARMDARIEPADSHTPIVTPPTWRTSERARRCWRCRSKTALLVYEVRHSRPERVYGEGTSWERRHPAEHWSTLSAVCLDTVACKARNDKRYEQRRKRSGNLRWAQSRFESPNIDLPKGACRWCGEAIVFVDDVPYRYKRRERHRGDEWEVGDGRNCRREHDRTFAANPRELIQHRGDPCCVDCGEAEVWVQPEEGEGYWLTGDWEADHVIPVEDGGPHTPVNIARRCVRCHREKTNRENAERRRRRLLDKPQVAR